MNSPLGVIGSRTGLKIRFPYGSASSSLAGGTTLKWSKKCRIHLRIDLVVVEERLVLRSVRLAAAAK